jgi:L-ascorbate metabolism protein UlaG (beta-lactamase superfamily)
MFDIEYKGGNAVLITTKERSLLIDGNLEALGLKNMKDKGVINLATERRFLPDNITEDSVVLEGPGEYEIGPYTIRGIAAGRMLDGGSGTNATIYRIEIGDVIVGVLGNISSELSDDQLEALGVIDILITPIGGSGYTLDATDAIKVIKAIEPKAVVPIHYANSTLKYEVPQESSERFEREFEANVEELAKLKVKGAISLPAVLTVYKLSLS